MQEPKFCQSWIFYVSTGIFYGFANTSSS
ncbi:unnamed protein product [Acanthoscelides obtectus]|uniref:Uncharacterized protein n=1 Tax=Acanthoscelides obtectus TaxID=200917 RepID=A0A9P0KPL2_ACAOB|nr:unnamed protein product [Acanthoscelides obtectus]CAK1631860.1 hypothetical protein AOBTE_LOCUS7210 [Acanthoscelides obtectus]